MKKKMIIGALALTTAFAFAETGEPEKQTNSRFFGSEITGVASCVQNGWFPDGSPKYNKVYEKTYYVFWIGVDTYLSEPIESSHCGMP